MAALPDFPDAAVYLLDCGVTEDEIEAICRNYENCDDCPLFNYCDEEMM